ncbi:MAG TPA: ferritin-like domain-containing protein [Chloroflexota bacterium]|nr:ferritin-like domain-containing protein [Chloroflexota bacterium]
MSTVLVSGQALADELVAQVRAFCHSLDARLPAYSYVPLTTDAQRLHVMKSRYWNELRAGEIFGRWLRGFTDLDVKLRFMEAVGEEARHAQLLAERIRAFGADPLDYEPVPGQIAMFNAFDALEDTVERVAAFSLAGEGVADYLIEKALASPNVPEWLKEPYRRIHADESEHGNYPAAVIARLATTPESQRRARRAVAMSLVLRRQYFDDLDQAVLHGKVWW